MSRPSGSVFLLVSLSFLLCAPVVAWAQWPTSPTVAVPLCAAVGGQFNPRTVPDGAGGAFVVWQDERNYVTTLDDIYIQHVTAGGAIAPGWPADGIALCTAADVQGTPIIVSDGLGGAIVVWEDFRNGATTELFAQRVNSSGSVLWTVGGVDLCTAPTGSRTGPGLATDGAGGAIVAWADSRGAAPGAGMYSQRISSAGSLMWTATGVKLNTGFTTTGTPPVVVSDGANGALFAWMDGRVGGLAGMDVYGQHLTAAGALAGGWVAAGEPLAVAAGQQMFPVGISDGLGGMFLAWTDSRAGAAFIFDVYVVRILANSDAAPGWLVTGNALCVAAGSQDQLSITTDASGGAIVAWTDDRSGNDDIYSQRISLTGSIPAGWAADGEPLAVVPGVQMLPAAVGDAANGVLVAWQDGRTGADDIYAQRITGLGAVGPALDPLGIGVATGAVIQTAPTAASDGAGGMIVAWEDSAAGAASGRNIVAKRVEHYGNLGNPAARIASVRDIPGDQGGHVRVAWEPSSLDRFPDFPIESYWVWRQVPADAAMTALARGAIVLVDAAEEGVDAARLQASAQGRALYRTSPGTLLGPYYWEYLASLPATGLSGYSYVAESGSDSTANGNPRTVFMVQAHHDPVAGETYWWDSDPDSGYSVDDLAPSVPSPFLGVYVSSAPGEAGNDRVTAGGAMALHWGASPEPDFSTYELHRGGSAAFVPAPGNLVTSQSDTGYVDSGVLPMYYKLCAVDIHGNRSPYALLDPNGLVDVPPDNGPTSVWLGPASPNPSRSLTTIPFGLSRAQRVAFTLYDGTGRLVRRLIAGTLPAGEHAALWDGKDAGGRAVRSGLYFFRLETEERVLEGRSVRFR